MPRMLPSIYLKDRQRLQHYCALCSQWIASSGKIKQHFRLSHASDYQQFLAPASRLRSKFNTPGSPGEDCGAVTKAPRQHPAKCTVLWQISLMRLKLLAARQGLADGILRPPGTGAAPSHGVDGNQEGSRARLGPFLEEQSLADRAGQGAPVEPGPRKQTTLAQRWGKRSERREPERRTSPTWSKRWHVLHSNRRRRSRS